MLKSSCQFEFFRIPELSGQLVAVSCEFNDYSMFPNSRVLVIG